MAMDKRHERMLEELLKVPGNETCADCHAIAPRWASVNLGIFICMSCASVHRKLGTHTSRVKSVTMDSWTRDQINALRDKGNNVSNAEWNPNEALHPPPTATGSEDRDSEIEKYIRRKYEQGAFRAGASGSRHAPTSLNRAREADGRITSGGADRRPFPPGRNNSNPELNDVLIVTSPASKDRDLPALPAARGDTMPRPRPSRSPSATDRPATAPGIRPLKKNPFGITPSSSATSMQLIDFEGGPTATRPLQVNAYDQGSSQFGSGNPFGQQTLAPSAMPHTNISQNGQQSPNTLSNGLQPANPFYHAGQFDQNSQSFQTPAPSPFHQPQQPLQQQHTMPPFQHQPNSFPPPTSQNQMSGFTLNQQSGPSGQYANSGNGFNANGYGPGATNLGGTAPWQSNAPQTNGTIGYDPRPPGGFARPHRGANLIHAYNLAHHGYNSIGVARGTNGIHGAGMNGMGGMNGGGMHDMSGMSGVNGQGTNGMNGMNGGGYAQSNTMNGMNGMNSGGYQANGFNPWAGAGMQNGAPGAHAYGFSNGMR